MPESASKHLFGRNLKPEILFEDTHLLVLSKPAGLLSQGEKTGDENLVDWLRQYLGRPYVGLVHRLDRNTSGIMVVAKRTKSAERLTRSLQEGKIFRSYVAWVEGRLEGTARWRHFLKKDERNNIVRVVPAGTSGAKEAVLSVKHLAYGVWNTRPVSLVEFILETGRSHQIRVQSAKEGYPLLGDRKYNLKTGGDFPRPALHSHRISFEHPMSHETMEFTAPLPEDLERIKRS